MSLNEPLMCLHRYYIWANSMRHHFDEALKSNSGHAEQDMMLLPYMSYWYGGLYVVIEGWFELKLKDAIKDELLTLAPGEQEHPNVALLRRYRNGSFHYQKSYYDQRFIELIREKDIVFWVRKLHEQFGRFFLEKMK